MASISGQVTNSVGNFIEGASNLLAGGVPVGTIVRTTAKAVGTMAVGVAASGIVNSYAKSRNLEAQKRQLGILSGKRLEKVEKIANSLDRIILSGIEDPNLEENPLKNELDTYLSFTNPVGPENGSNDGKVLASLGGIKHYLEGGWGHEAAIDDFLNRQVKLSTESFSHTSKVSFLLLANKIQALIVMIRKYAELPGDENAARLDKLCIALNNLLASYPSATGARIDNVEVLQDLINKFVVEKKKAQNALTLINVCHAAKSSVAELAVDYAEFGLRLLDNNCAQRQSKTDLVSLMRGVASNNLASRDVTPINSPVGQLISELMSEIHLALHDFHDERKQQSGSSETFDIVQRLEAITNIMENKVTQEIIDNLRSALPDYLKSISDHDLQLFALGFVQVLSKLAIAEALLDDAEKLAKDYGQNVPSTSDGYALRIELALESKKSAERIMDKLNVQNGLCKHFFKQHIKKLDGDRQDLKIPMVDSVAIGVPEQIRPMYSDSQPDGVLNSVHVNRLNHLLLARNESHAIFDSLEISSKRKKTLDKKDSILDTPNVLFTMAMTMATSRKSATKEDIEDLQNLQLDDKSEYEAKLVFMVTVDRIQRLFGYIPSINKNCEKASLPNRLPQINMENIKSGDMLAQLNELRQRFEELANTEMVSANRAYDDAKGKALSEDKTENEAISAGLDAKLLIGDEYQIALDQLNKTIRDVQSLSELLGVGVGLKASNERKIQPKDETAVSQIVLLRNEIKEVESRLESYDATSVLLTEKRGDEVTVTKIVPIKELSNIQPLIEERPDISLQDKVKLRIAQIETTDETEERQNGQRVGQRTATNTSGQNDSTSDDILPPNDEQRAGSEESLIDTVLGGISGLAGQVITSTVKLKDDLKNRMANTVLTVEDRTVRFAEDVGDIANSGIDFVVNGIAKLTPAILFAASLEAKFDVSTSVYLGLGALAANGVFGLLEDRVKGKMLKSFSALEMSEALKIDEVSRIMDEQIIRALHPDVNITSTTYDDLDPKIRRLMLELKDLSGPKTDSDNANFRKIERLRGLRLDGNKSTDTESRIKGLFDNYYELKAGSMDKAYAYVVLYENKLEIIMQLMKIYSEQPGENSEKMLRKLSSSLKLLNSKFLEVSMADEIGLFQSQSKRKHLGQALSHPISLFANEMMQKQKNITLQMQIRKYGDKLVQQTCSMSQFMMYVYDADMEDQLTGVDANLPIPTPTLDALSKAKFNLDTTKRPSNKPTCLALSGMLILLNQANDGAIDFDDAKAKIAAFSNDLASPLVGNCFKKIIQITLEVRRLEQEAIMNGSKGFEEPAVFEAKIVELMQQYENAKVEFNALFSKDSVCQDLKSQHLEDDAVRVDMSTKLGSGFTMGADVKSIKESKHIRILQQCSQIDKELAQTGQEIRNKIDASNGVPVIPKRVYQSEVGRLRMVRDRDTIDGLSYVLLTKRIAANAKSENVSREVRSDYRKHLDSAKDALMNLIRSKCSIEITKEWLLMTLELKYQNALIETQFERNLLNADNVLQDCFRLFLLAERASNDVVVDLSVYADLCRFMQMNGNAINVSMNQDKYIRQTKPVEQIFSDKDEYSSRINSFDQVTNDNGILLFQCYEQILQLKHLSSFLREQFPNDRLLDVIDNLQKPTLYGATHESLHLKFTQQQQLITDAKRSIYEQQIAVFNKNNESILQAGVSRVQGSEVSQFEIPEPATPERMLESIKSQQRLLQMIESERQAIAHGVMGVINDKYQQFSEKLKLLEHLSGLKNDHTQFNQYNSMKGALQSQLERSSVLSSQDCDILIKSIEQSTAQITLITNSLMFELVRQIGTTTAQPVQKRFLISYISDSYNWSGYCQNTITAFDNYVGLSLSEKEHNLSVIETFDRFNSVINELSDSDKSLTSLYNRQVLNSKLAFKVLSLANTSPETLLLGLRNLANSDPNIAKVLDHFFHPVVISNLSMEDLNNSSVMENIVYKANQTLVELKQSIDSTLSDYFSASTDDVPNESKQVLRELSSQLTSAIDKLTQQPNVVEIASLRFK